VPTPTAKLTKRLQRAPLVARELATGKLAGFTETFWRPSNAELLQQGGTGVWPQFRNKGLGRWLKAAYKAAKADDRLQRSGEKMTSEKVVDWLLR